MTSTKKFVWVGDAPAEERNAGNTVTRRFYDEGEQIGANGYLFNKDHLGSIRQMTDSSGVVAAAYDYDPYGRQESGLPAGMTVWLSADSGIYKDASNKVISWEEQSGSGNAATAPSTGARPTWVASGLNGQPVLHFDGDDELDGEAEFDGASSDATIFVVSKRTSAVAWAAPFSLNRGANGNPLLTWDATNNYFGANNAGVSVDGVYMDLSGVQSDAYVFSYTRKGTDLTVRAQGSAGQLEAHGTQTWTSGANPYGSYYVGRHYAGGNFLNGDVAEVIVYNRALSPAERTRVESYLGQKYGTATADSDMRYTGDYYHAPSALNLTLYRAYDANLGRWISRDPLGDPSLRLISKTADLIKDTKTEQLLSSGLPAEMLQGPNLYKYVSNNPVDFRDPYGLWTLGFGVQGSGGVGAGGAVSAGIFVGWSKCKGFSFNILFTGAAGAYVGAGESIGGFVDVTNADSVNSLKGEGISSGGSAGEVASIGADYHTGKGGKCGNGDYSGVQLRFFPR